jgi:hypothetical protein
MTTYANNVTVAAAIDSEIVPMFTAAAIMPQLVAAYTVDIPNTNAKRVPRSGAITASVVAEAVAASPQAVVDTSVLLTLQKAVVLTNPSVEALRFASNGANSVRHTALAAQACADKFDIDACALANGFSQVVDSATALTVAKLQEAAFTLRLAKLPDTRAAFVGHVKQTYQLESDMRASGSAIYGNPNFKLDPLQGAGQSMRGYKGTLFGIEVWETTNGFVDTAPTPDDYVGMVICPQFALAALYPEGSAPSFQTEIDASVDFKSGIVNVRTYMWYALGELVDAAGVALKSDI